MAAQKVREKGRKREKMEKSGKAESFLPILLLSQKFIFDYSAGAYILPQPSKITKKNKIKSYYKGLIWKKTIREQNKSKSNQSQESEQWPTR